MEDLQTSSCLEDLQWSFDLFPKVLDSSILHYVPHRKCKAHAPELQTVIIDVKEGVPSKTQDRIIYYQVRVTLHAKITAMKYAKTPLTISK